MFRLRLWLRLWLGSRLRLSLRTLFWGRRGFWFWFCVGQFYKACINWRRMTNLFCGRFQEISKFPNDGQPNDGRQWYWPPESNLLRSRFGHAYHVIYVLPQSKNVGRRRIEPATSPALPCLAVLHCPLIQPSFFVNRVTTA